MPFSKSFPRQSKTSTYPQWEEVTLTDAEEKLEENKSRTENIKLMKAKNKKAVYSVPSQKWRY